MIYINNRFRWLYTVPLVTIKSGPRAQSLAFSPLHPPFPYNPQYRPCNYFMILRQVYPHPITGSRRIRTPHYLQYRRGVQKPVTEGRILQSDPLIITVARPNRCWTERVVAI